MNRVTLRSGRADDAGDCRPAAPRPDGALPAWVSEVVRHRARPEARRAAVGADQRQAAHAGDGRRRAVARVHLRRALGHARPARLRRLLGRPRGARRRLRHGRRVQPRRRQAGAGRRRARGDRRAAAPARRATAGARRIGRADQISHAMLDNEIKEQHVLGTRAAGDLPRRRGVPAQRGGLAPGGHAARADRGAEGAGLPEPADRRRTT